MRFALPLCLAVILCASCVSGEGNPPPREFDFQKDAWSKSPYASIVDDGGVCLKVAVPADCKQDNCRVSVKLDPETVKGCTLLIEGEVKAENVTEPLKPWNGVKLQFHSDGGLTGPLWKDMSGDKKGTFGWRQERFIVRVPGDILVADLMVGLESCTGTAWFRNLKLSVLKRPEVKVVADSPSLMFKGHSLPRLRGVMSPNSFKEEDFKNLADWNVNFVRWQMTSSGWNDLKDPSLEKRLSVYDAWLKAKMEDLDKALDAAERYGIMLVIDIHEGPGGRAASKENNVFYDKACQQKFIETWRILAARYKDRKQVLGYDLLNEPLLNTPVPEGLLDWQDLAELTAEEIRKIDPKTPIIMESEDWDCPAAFAWLKPLNVPNVIYQVHMYVPGSFTHQGVHSKIVGSGTVYPGKIDGKAYDREELRRVLSPVIEFQRRYNAQIYVGEFSAIRWAPGAAQYLSDCIDLYEDYGWDWTYHAYREWDGWSVEHEGERSKTQVSKGNDRKQVLLNWFSKNVKADFSKK